MKLILEPTAQIVEVNGVPCRQWEGKTESGTTVAAFITRVAVPEDAGAEAHREFERELTEKPAPRADMTFPLRLVL